MLVNDVLPKVLPVVQQHEENLRKMEAIANRKRSSRLMLRELEALEKSQPFLLGETRRSSRREEMARKREEEERKKAANAREERLRAREERILKRELAQAESEKREAMAQSKQEQKKNQSAVAGKKRGRKPKSRNQQEEDAWFFDCICGVSGQNIVSPYSRINL